MRRSSRFLAVLSHELRNPLAPIQNSLYVIEHETAGSDAAVRAREVIGRQVRQLAKLVDDLLDVTRVSSNKVHLELERLDLNQVVRQTLEDHRSLFEAAGVSLEATLADGPVFVKADRARVAQVIGNLLNNAAKFTATGGCAKVVVARDDDARVAAVSVIDTGAGMAPEILERLFQSFAQADRTLSRSKGGLGLGLALVKGLVELHGGDVTAHSAGPGRGTEIVVRLPLDASAIDATPTKPVASRGARRVLIIEDNVDAAESLRDLLMLGEHEVAVALNGPDGLAQVRAFRPDVVLCDIGLPGMDGYDVARAIRADESLRDVYLVALSGYAMPEDLERAVEAGFHRHMAKPPDLEKLEQVLADISP